MSWTAIASLVIFGPMAIWALGTLVIGALSGKRSCVLALSVMALSLVPLVVRLQACQGGQRDGDPLIECLDMAPTWPLLGVMWSLYTAFMVVGRADDQRRMDRYSAAWRQLAAASDQGWREEGASLIGTYRGRRLTASAHDHPRLHQYAPGDSDYRVSIFLPPGGQDWGLRRRRACKPPFTAIWRVHSSDARLAQQLEAAGAMELAGRAEPYLDVSATPRITYRAQEGDLMFKNNWGFVPNEAAFRVHLELLTALARDGRPCEPTAPRIGRPMTPRTTCAAGLAG